MSTAMDIAQVLAYYRQQSALSDPGRQAALYEDLPRDPAALARVVQGVIIHPGWLKAYGVRADEIENTVFGPRRMEELLTRIYRRHPAPLTEARPPALRIGAICRNFAVLFVSLLRHQGVPARARVGFGGYFGGARAYDHRIAEYWDNAQQRWVLADAQMDDLQRRRLRLSFDPLDIRPDDPFWLAGEAWLRCRSGELRPEDFGDSDTDIGMPPIRYALLQDFAYLNKCEMPGNDNWGELISKPEEDLTANDLALLDRIATLTLQVDTRFDELRALFDACEYGRTVQAHIEALS